ncbi:MAG: polymer-forming cytoskeletal protein [Lysobacterales bacterium]
MWKKDESDKSSAPPFAESGGSDAGPAKSFSTSPPAVVGSSLTVNGNIAGTEDLLVEGKVEGDISLPDNVVTVGTGGIVKARIKAAVIIVEGRVEGDLVGEEQIEVRRSGHVLGNIQAPRVGLEDGAQFKGNIDMSPKKPPASSPAAGANAKTDTGNHAKSSGPTADAKLPGKV